MLLMDITDGHHIFAGDAGEMFLRAVAGGDEGDIELIARGFRAKDF